VIQRELRYFNAQLADPDWQRSAARERIVGPWAELGMTTDAVDGPLLRAVVAALDSRAEIMVEHAEFRHYGSGYASFVDVLITCRDGSQRFRGTRGFSRDAQEYALARQISLIDLSMLAFQPLRTLVETTADQARAGLEETWSGSTPLVHALRETVRRALEGSSEGVGSLPWSAAWPLQAMAEALRGRTGRGLVLAFPPAPFVLGLVPDDVSAFERYSLRHPTHAVRLRRTDRSGAHSTWVVHPVEQPDASTMTFGLPEQVEAWILDQDETVRSRTRWVKSRLLSTMTIYWLGDDHAHTFSLRYEPWELREGRARPA
jgi:hypothetical protein